MKPRSLGVWQFKVVRVMVSFWIVPGREAAPLVPMSIVDGYGVDAATPFEMVIAPEDVKVCARPVVGQSAQEARHTPAARKPRATAPPAFSYVRVRFCSCKILRAGFPIYSTFPSIHLPKFCGSKSLRTISTGVSITADGQTNTCIDKLYQLLTLIILY